MRAEPLHAQADTGTAILRASLDALRQAIEIGTPAFILVDPLTGEPIPGIEGARSEAALQGAREVAWQREVTRIPLHESTKLPLHLHPYLVGLKGPDDPLLARTFELARQESAACLADGLNTSGQTACRIGGWLQSTLSPPRLAQAMSSMFRLRTEAWTNATCLRLADRRVLGYVLHVVGTQRVAESFGRLRAWIWMDLRGRLRILESAGEEPRTLQLSWQEWRRVEAGHLIQHTLACWIGELELAGTAALADSGADMLYARAEQALQEAWRDAKRWPQRFREPEDAAVWAALRLLHPGLSVSPAVSAWMEARGVAEAPSAIRDACREILELTQTTASTSSPSR